MEAETTLNFFQFALGAENDACASATARFVIRVRLLRNRQDKRLADFAESNAFWRFVQGQLETFDRFWERFEAQSERLMVYWHDELRVSIIGHLHRLFRITMSPDPRVVTPNRHDR